MPSVNINISDVRRQPMLWLEKATDGGSLIRQVNSWQELEEVVINNGLDPRLTTFDEGVLETLEELWGKPNSME